MSATNTKSTATTASGRSETLSHASAVAKEKLHEAGQHFVTEPARDIFRVLKDYANEKPDVAAMWCFGLGLIVGWKLRG